MNNHYNYQSFVNKIKIFYVCIYILFITFYCSLNFSYERCFDTTLSFLRSQRDLEEEFIKL